MKNLYEIHVEISNTFLNDENISVDTKKELLSKIPTHIIGENFADVTSKANQMVINLDQGNEILFLTGLALVAKNVNLM